MSETLDAFLRASEAPLSVAKRHHDLMLKERNEKQPEGLSEHELREWKYKLMRRHIMEARKAAGITEQA